MNSFIEPLREQYKKLIPVFCPYINQSVVFTSSGFKHLIWKGEHGMRLKSVIYDRFEALTYVAEIISKSGTLQEYEKIDLHKEYLCFIAIINQNKYKVVITKTSDNNYKFVSVIPKWKTGKRDDFVNK